MKKRRWIKKTFTLILCGMLLAMMSSGVSVKATGMEDILAFPVSYRDDLMKLKEAHPQWSFVPMVVDAEWTTAVNSELVGSRSLVHSSKGAGWKRDQHSPGWYYATRAAVEYCMDPRNFLTEENIFMFEQLTFNPRFHSLEGVQKILQSSFMAGEVPGEETTYAEVFYNVGDFLKVSPYHLACRVYQEQGKGTSPLISGEYPGYEGLYNYFNVKAAGTTNEQIIVSGLEYAKKVEWTTRSASIQGGATFVSQSYILKGQDTLYLQKFDVDPTFQGMYSHQYQQNITAPITEGANIRKAYSSAEALDNEFVFKIPVYRNMPQNACPVPVAPTKPVNQVVDANLVYEFVSRMYTVALGREAEPDGLQDWSSQLMEGKNDGAGLAAGFIESREFENRNLSDSDYVEVLYKTFFDREADESGKNDWMRALRSGKSREYVLSGFVNSLEFQNLTDRFGIKRGELYTNGIPKREGVRGYVERMYLFALGRSGEEAGIQNWVDSITSKTQSPVEVAKSFLNSAEFINRRLDDENYVEALYQTFMGRESDPEGKAYWIGMLARKERTREQVADGFANSQEFMGIVKSFGLDEKTILLNE